MGDSIATIPRTLQVLHRTTKTWQQKQVGGYPGPESPPLYLKLYNARKALMLSRFAHYIPAIRPPIPWLPSSLGPSRIPAFFRTYSWSSQSQPANWSHLNDIYGKSVDLNPKGPPMSPEERWDMLSRSRILTLPKGPYAGKVVLYVESTVDSFTCPGRSFDVKNGDVADALNKLQYTLRRNKVSSELRLAARHEKKGYKRRRLSSERWRRRFAHEVIASSLTV